MPRQPDSLQGTLDLLILTTLEREPHHGFGITLHLQTASGGALQVEEGSLYPALHRLERAKLIRGEWKVTDNGRRARYYRITAAGARRLADAKQSWDTLSRSVGKVLRYT
jgi:PadR family transcriptional regulator PadR